MARSFNGSSQYLSLGSAVITGTPYSIAGWARYTTGVSGAILGVGNTGTTTNYTSLDFSSGGNVRARSSVPAGTSNAQSSTTTTSGVWAHAAGVWASATDRRAFLNGGGKGTSSTSRVPSGLNRTEIGRRGPNTANDWFTGDLAEVAVWNIDLTDAEVAFLATGALPLLVRPENLVDYVPLVGRHSLEPDYISGNTFTLTGSPGQADHPRIFLPVPQGRSFVSQAGGNTYNEDYSDSATVADNNTAQATFAATVSESVAAADSYAVTVTVSAAVNESVTAADSNAAVTTFVTTVSESVTAADSVVPSLITSGAISESVTAADSVAASLTASASTSDSVTAADSNAAQATFAATVSESTTVADSNAATAIFLTSISEGIAADDLMSSGGTTYQNDYDEDCAAGDSYAVRLIAATAIAESVTAAESLAALLTANALLTESVAGTDTYTAALSASATLAESITAAEAMTAALTAITAFSESLTAADAYAGTRVVLADYSENVTADDSLTAILRALAVYSEDVTAEELYAAVATMGDSIAEDVTAGDDYDARASTAVLGLPVIPALSGRAYRIVRPRDRSGVLTAKARPVINSGG